LISYNDKAQLNIVTAVYMRMPGYDHTHGPIIEQFDETETSLADSPVEGVGA